MKNIDKLKVLYKDNLLLVVNKLPGMLSQGGKHNRLSINDYLNDLKFDYKEHTPKPLHRLDYNTSGCLLLGRTAQSAKAFSAELANNKILKEYLGVVTNVNQVHLDEGVINHPILVKSNGRPDLGGDKPTMTFWKILRYNKENKTALCRFVIKTGRKHQIRLHTSRILGWPILGDYLYSNNINKNARDSTLYLHASAVEFTRFKKDLNGKAHKVNVRVEAPIPTQWKETIDLNKFNDCIEFSKPVNEFGFGF